ncbi:hypothetical protein CTI12_AA556840 [Artemisia annua]|uniref:Transmembrane protein n=1 Tax=Artemisia annua TaxID=35608 RepID=A0A2U1KVV2_ARTAN|nr:hypothetical protein CTI12_AA556840 [Artemisia annua]
MKLTAVHILNLTGVLTESRRIIKANYTHFVTLSLLFLPLSFPLITCPIPQLSNHLSTTDKKTIIYQIIYILIAYTFTLCAIATITYTTHHGFLGKPVSFFASLKSLTFTFFPILSTAVVASTVIFLNLLSFLMLVGSVLMLVQNIGLVIDYNSVYIMLFIGVTLIMIMIYFHVNWSLALVVVVVESKWGFGALMRSSYLMQGMRSASLLLLLYFGTFSALFMWVLRGSLHELSIRAFVFFTILGSSFMIWFLLHSTAANTVLYNYCKALHGESAIEIADQGSDHEYANLSPGDEKVSHAVTVVTT